MKKTALIAMAAVLCFAACQKDEGKALSPDKQKSYIQDVAIEAVEMLDIDNWRPQANIFVGSFGANGTLANAEPDAELEKWAKGLENLQELRLSAILGEFTVANGIVSRKDSDKLTLDYSINEVLPCHAEIVIEDSETSVTIPAIEIDIESKEVVPAGIKPLSSTPEAEPATIPFWIPKSIDARLSAAGEEGLAFHLDADVNLAGSEPTPNDTYSLKSTFTSGDYAISFGRAYYSPTEIEFSSSFKKGGTTILESSIIANGELKWLEDDGDYELDQAKSEGKVKVSASILGKVSVNGSADFSKYKKLIAGASITSEDEARQFAKNLEKCFDLYFSCKGSKQARLGFAYLGEEGIQAVIRFEDGSSYQLPEEYFNEESFTDLMETSVKIFNKIEAGLGL